MLRDRKIPLEQRPVSRFARAAASGLVDLFYPPMCLHCQARVAPDTLLCRMCRSHLERVDAEATASLLERLDTNWIDQLIAVWYFDKGSPVQDVQHALKYGNRPSCAGWLGAYLSRACTEQMNEAADVVVPVPLHRTRQLERGYNQSAYIADSVGEGLRLPVRIDHLERPRATLSQTTLTRAERRNNLSDVFRTPHRQEIHGRHVLLIDDVVTTGATMESSAIALKAAGARRVTAAAIGLARH